MRKVYFLIVIFSIIANIANAQVWIGSSTGGDYQTASNWSTGTVPLGAADVIQFNPIIDDIAVYNVPAASIGGIKINSGTKKVSFETSGAAKTLTLNAATPLIYTTAGSILSATLITLNLSNPAAFSINSGTFGIVPSTAGAININSAITLNGTGILDFDVAGTGGTTITGSITYSGGTFVSSVPAAIFWAGGSNYFHQFSGNVASAIPVSNWNSNSTCTINGMNLGATAPTGLTNSNFGNFTWNCPSQVADVNLKLAGATLTVFSKLMILSTGSKYLVLSDAGNGTVSAGSYDQISNTPKVMLQLSSGLTTLIVLGTFNHTSGVIEGVGTVGTGLAVLDLKGTVNKSATWQSTGTSTSSQMTIQFSGTSLQNVIIGGAWTAGNICNITITNTAGISLSGTLKVISTQGTSAVPAMCSMGGPIISGSISYTPLVTGIFTLMYNNSASQAASAIEFPLTNGPTNLTINNGAGVTFPNSFSRDIYGTLTLQAGNLSIEPSNTGNILSLLNPVLGSQITYISGFIITGTLSRLFPTLGLPTNRSDAASRFPFGTGITDRSINVFFSSTTLGSGTGGRISVSHTPAIGITAFSVTDNTPVPVNLDKRTNTSWGISTVGFSIGAGPEKISITALATNIGSVASLATIAGLRLTDGVPTPGSYSNLKTIPTAGDDIAPIVGKYDLTEADITNKTLYVGSDNTNLLTIITFTWTGSNGTNWADALNWTTMSGSGYPSAPTENAIVPSGPINMPNITGPTSISVYELTVANGASLTLTGTGSINVFAAITFNGTAYFDPTSFFYYSGQGVAQNIAPVIFGNLILTGLAPKILPNGGTVSVRGVTNANGPYKVSGTTPTIGNSTFVYDGAGKQRIEATSYYNLTLKNDRGNNQIIVGNLLNNSSNEIKVYNVFDVTTIKSYTTRSDYNTFNFASTGSQFIPGFKYGGAVYNLGNGDRTWDSQGSTDPYHVIECQIFARTQTPGFNNVTGSKVKIDRTGTAGLTFTAASNRPSDYYDLEITGNFGGGYLRFGGAPKTFNIGGQFTISAINFVQQKHLTEPGFIFNFNGAIVGFDQVIPATYEKGFNFDDIIINGTTNRKIKFEELPNSVGFRGTLSIVTAFTPPYGFVTLNSTVNFNTGSKTIPVLPAASGNNSYNNVSVTGGTWQLGGDMVIGGNLVVSGTDASVATLNVGNTISPRTLNVLGNILVNGTTAVPKVTGQIDMNSSSATPTKINLGGNLSITGTGGQLEGTGSLNGTVVFNSVTPLVQTYTNSSFYKNGAVNFTVGTGLTTTTLSLVNSSIDLLSSATAAKMSTLTVADKASLDVATKNIISNGTGNANFNLNSGATFITANTGGVEGAASSPTDGSISNNANITKVYDPAASYVFNASSNTITNFPGVITTPFSMSNLSFGNDANAATFSLNKYIDVGDTLKLKNNAVLAVGENFLNLKSISTKTARIATVPDNASITYGINGRFVVERYYPARRAWRLITAPISADAGIRTVFNSWQLGGKTTYAPDGNGVYVSGPGANLGTNGLDPSQQSNYSLKTYDGTKFIGVSDTKGLLLSGTSTTTATNFGMFQFVRGDRSTQVNLFSTYWANTTTLRDTGKVQIKAQTFTLVNPNNGYNLVGNPFASTIDITNVMSTATNINPIYFWAFDPFINTQQGAYVTMTLVGGNWLPTPSSSSQNKFIQSSQAFFVQKNNDAVGSITFAETDKTSQKNIGTFREAYHPIWFRANLYLQETDSIALADGILVLFDNTFNSAVDPGDAAKFGNTKETFALVRDAKNLAVERRQTIVADDTLFFKLTRTEQRNYQFEFVPSYMDISLIAFLEDSYTNTKTIVSLTSTSTFNFTVNSDAASAAPDRFKIVFKASVGMPLPVTYKSIKAYQQGDNIAVDWTVENEINISKYEVEKSTDGVNFTKVNTTLAKGTNSSSIDYKFVDNNAVQGKNFYHILSFNQSGAFEYSRVVVVKLGKADAGISIYPNPVKGNTIGLTITNMEKGIYQLRLVNTIGQTVMTSKLTHATGNEVETLTPNIKLATGIYHLEITAPDNSNSFVKVIVQ